MGKKARHTFNAPEGIDFPEFLEEFQLGPQKCSFPYPGRHAALLNQNIAAAIFF